MIKRKSFKVSHYYNYFILRSMYRAGLKAINNNQYNKHSFTIAQNKCNAEVCI